MPNNLQQNTASLTTKGNAPKDSLALFPIFANTALETIADCTANLNQVHPPPKLNQTSLMEPSEQPTFPNRPSISLIVTPIIANRLAEYLNGYDKVKAEFLIQRFSEGFIIPFQGHLLFRFSKNLSSLNHNEHIFLPKFQQEFHRGDLWAPLKTLHLKICKFRLLD